MVKLLVLLISCCVVLTFAKLPAYMKKCSIKDPNLDSCVLNSAREAFPHLIKGEAKLKFPVMDPLFVPELGVHEPGIEAVMQNATVTGFTETVLEKLSYDHDKKEVTFQGTVPNLNFTGNYSVSGKLASLPIYGNGPFSTTFFNLTIKFKATYDLLKLDDGKVYMIFKDYDADMLPQLVVSRLENMFNGNKVLGDIMNNFLNDNWRLIYKEYGKQTSQAMGGLLFHIFSESSKIVPFNELFEDAE